MVDADSLVTRLKEAVADLDKELVEVLCDTLVNTWPREEAPFPTSQARSFLSLLRSKRYFDDMRRVGQSLISQGQHDARVRRLYAQALIECGELSAARGVLRDIIDDPESSAGEVAEAWGLTGRAYKQEYVDNTETSPERRAELLRSAIEAYRRPYEEDREANVWHGINLVALLARAERDGVRLSDEEGSGGPVEDYRELARAIRDAIREEGRLRTIWDYSTAMEASIALDDGAAAIAWAEKYVGEGLSGAQADAFEFESTLRQMREVWQAEPKELLERTIIPLLEGALLEVGVRGTEGGSVSLRTDALPRIRTRENYDRLERVFGQDRYKRVQWLKTAIDRCRSIARVTRKNTGEGVGTGFVLNGKSLSTTLEADWYLLTNSHVVTDDEEVLAAAPAGRKPLRPDQASITFELLFEETPRRFTVREVVWTSPPDELDATLLSLDDAFYEGVEPYAVNPDLQDPQLGPRLYIAGHPGGYDLAVSLHDNHLLEFDDRLMQYRTPTNPGSSGSPIFNDAWELVGLHHAGSEKKPGLHDPGIEREANEGIRIGAIMKGLQEVPRRNRPPPST